MQKTLINNYGKLKFTNLQINNYYKLLTDMT